MNKRRLTDLLIDQKAYFVLPLSRNTQVLLEAIPDRRMVSIDALAVNKTTLKDVNVLFFSTEQSWLNGLKVVKTAVSGRSLRFMSLIMRSWVQVTCAVSFSNHLSYKQVFDVIFLFPAFMK